MSRLFAPEQKVSNRTEVKALQAAITQLPKAHWTNYDKKRKIIHGSGEGTDRCSTQPWGIGQCLVCSWLCAYGHKQRAYWPLKVSQLHLSRWVNAQRRPDRGTTRRQQHQQQRTQEQQKTAQNCWRQMRWACN